MADSRDVAGGPGPPEQIRNTPREKKRRHGHSSGLRDNVKDDKTGGAENREKSERGKSKESGSEPSLKSEKSVDSVKSVNSVEKKSVDSVKSVKSLDSVKSVNSVEKKSRSKKHLEEKVPRNGAGDGDLESGKTRDRTTQERERLGREAEADRRTNISAPDETERGSIADRKKRVDSENGKNKIEKDLENFSTERPASGRTVAKSQKEKIVKEHARSYSDGGAGFLSPSRQRSYSNGQHSDQGIYDNEHSEVLVRSRSLKYNRQESRADYPPRLLVVSSKIKNIMSLQNALLPQVTFVQYKYETSTFDGLLGLIGQFLLNKKFHSVAFVLHGPAGVIQLCGKEDKPLNKDTVLDHAGIRGFFSKLFNLHSNKEATNLRLDFLASNAAQGQDGGQGIVKEFEALLGVPVGLSRDIAGVELVNDPSSKSTVGELYLRVERLRGWSGHYQQSMAGFEKIRTVGKGAYGAAVLYRKRDDDSLVILKEINMHDLNAAERQLALNEVKVLAVLDHPNIISYYDSFEEDGVLMIEMEYANGGTLAQYLSHQDAPLDEKEILEVFQQMVAAIRHIHEHNILHRDMKTANIFLTKEGIVKVGDFGISKIMSTADKGANTVLGTPYYISPEMCEGKDYNDKSDIWALGCILYEMACLQKTFEGSNLPALVNKIMKGQFAPVKGNYSEDFKNLIKDMLEREPEYRPSANELMYRRLPELIRKYEDPTTDYDDDLMTSADSTIMAKKKTRSVLYYLETSTMCLSPLDLPAKVKIREVAIGSDHVIVVSIERAVFTWGEGTKGQLGHGNLESVLKPVMVEALKGKSITKACCGDGFSVFASDNGIVMTCGDGASGSLGHGDWCSTSRPRLIEALLSVDVIAVASGTQHVVAVGSDGEVHSWGKGAFGRLGHGNEEDCCQPMEVRIEEPVFVRDVRCGTDGTVLLTDVGSLYAFGNNSNNKLGLNQRQGFLMAMKNIFNKTEVENRKEPTLVKAMTRHRVIDVSMGADHTAILVEPGRVYTLGKNSEGQLGMGNMRPQPAPVEVKSMLDKTVTRAQCGDHYTVVSTLDNELYFWGVRFKKPPTPTELRTPTRNYDPPVQGHSRQASNASVSSLSSIKEQESTETSVSALAMKSSEQKDYGSSGGPSADSRPLEQQTSSDSVLSSTNTNDTPSSTLTTESVCRGFRPLSSTPRRTPSASSTKERTNEKEQTPTNNDDLEVILHPTHILRLQTSTSNPQGEMVYLSNFFCHGENLFVQVETTAPPPKRKARKRRSFRKRFSTNHLPLPQLGNQHLASASSREGGDEYSSETEMDTYGTIPGWIKQELANSEVDMNDGNEADDTDSDSRDRPSSIIDASMSSIQINKDLRQGDKIKRRLASSTTTRMIESHSRAQQSHQGSAHSKLNDQESGVEFTPVDLLSSSSADEISDPGPLMERRREAHHGITNKAKLSVATPRKISAPVPYKAKNSPTMSHKPLNRLRAKGRRGDGSGSTSPAQRSRDESLESELNKLMAEKAKIEQRLEKMEIQHRRQSESIKKESENMAKERERQLMMEIHALRGELSKQNDKLKDNYDCMRSLQEELLKVSSEQRRMTAREQRSKQQPAQRDSKVCTIQ